MRTKRFGPMDIDETPWPIRSMARATCCRREKNRVQDCTQQIFGRPLEVWEYTGLSGAPNEAVVHVGVLPAGLVLEFRPPHTDDYFARRVVYRVPSGPVLIDDGLRIFRQAMHRHGLGLRIYLRQVLHASILGVRHIRAFATRGLYENGYYTWPRYGFDGPLPAEVLRRLPRTLSLARSVLDLMETEPGRRWWQKHGTSVAVQFDLSPSSRSWQVFSQYVAKRLKVVLDDMLSAASRSPCPAQISLPTFAASGQTVAS